MGAGRRRRTVDVVRERKQKRASFVDALRAVRDGCHDQTQKADAGKAPLGLLPWNALDEVARVREYGNQKYAPESWKEVRPGSRYLDAALRHLSAYARGEDVDDESGLSTLAHAACNVLFLIELEKLGVACRHEKYDLLAASDVVR